MYYVWIGYHLEQNTKLLQRDQKRDSQSSFVYRPSDFEQEVILYSRLYAYRETAFHLSSLITKRPTLFATIEVRYYVLYERDAVLKSPYEAAYKNNYLFKLTCSYLASYSGFVCLPCSVSTVNPRLYLCVRGETGIAQ